MTSMITDYDTQDIAMNLIMSGYATADDVVKKASAIKAGLTVIDNLNKGAVEESEKCKIYRKVWKLIDGEYVHVAVDTSTTRAQELIELKNVEWKMMTDITGLNEFQIIEVA